MTGTVRFWDRQAERYSRRKIKDVVAYEATVDRVRTYLKPTDTVLELGCGTGTTALLIADAVAHLTGTDLSPNMIEIARRKAEQGNHRNVAFAVSDAAATGFPAGGFDAVLAFNLTHLLPDPREAALAVRRVLRPGGLFISKTPCISETTWLLRPLICGMRAFNMAPDVTYLSFKHLEQGIETAGFDILETGLYPTGSFSRFVVARRRDDH